MVQLRKSAPRMARRTHGNLVLPNPNLLRENPAKLAITRLRATPVRGIVVCPPNSVCFADFESSDVAPVKEFAREAQPGGKELKRMLLSFAFVNIEFAFY